jgi:hypothetical protein
MINNKIFVFSIDMKQNKILTRKNNRKAVKKTRKQIGGNTDEEEFINSIIVQLKTIYTEDEIKLQELYNRFYSWARKKDTGEGSITYSNAEDKDPKIKPVHYKVGSKYKTRVWQSKHFYIIFKVTKDGKTHSLILSNDIFRSGEDGKSSRKMPNSKEEGLQEYLKKPFVHLSLREKSSKYLTGNFVDEEIPDIFKGKFAQSENTLQLTRNGIQGGFAEFKLENPPAPVGNAPPPGENPPALFNYNSLLHILGEIKDIDLTLLYGNQFDLNPSANPGKVQLKAIYKDNFGEGEYLLVFDILTTASLKESAPPEESPSAQRMENYQRIFFTGLDEEKLEIIQKNNPDIFEKLEVDGKWVVIRNNKATTLNYVSDTEFNVNGFDVKKYEGSAKELKGIVDTNKLLNDIKEFLQEQFGVKSYIKLLEDILKTNDFKEKKSELNNFLKKIAAKEIKYFDNFLCLKDVSDNISGVIFDFFPKLSKEQYCLVKSDNKVFGVYGAEEFNSEKGVTEVVSKYYHIGFIVGGSFYKILGTITLSYDFNEETKRFNSFQIGTSRPLGKDDFVTPIKYFFKNSLPENVKLQKIEIGENIKIEDEPKPEQLYEPVGKTIYRIKGVPQELALQIIEGEQTYYIINNGGNIELYSKEGESFTKVDKSTLEDFQFYNGKVVVKNIYDDLGEPPKTSAAVSQLAAGVSQPAAVSQSAAESQLYTPMSPNVTELTKFRVFLKENKELQAITLHESISPGDKDYNHISHPKSVVPQFYDLGVKDIYKYVRDGINYFIINNNGKIEAYTEDLYQNEHYSQVVDVGKILQPFYIVEDGNIRRATPAEQIDTFVKQETQLGKDNIPPMDINPSEFYRDLREMYDIGDMSYIVIQDKNKTDYFLTQFKIEGTDIDLKYGFGFFRIGKESVEGEEKDVKHSYYFFNNGENSRLFKKTPKGYRKINPTEIERILRVHKIEIKNREITRPAPPATQGGGGKKIQKNTLKLKKTQNKKRKKIKTKRRN